MCVWSILKFPVNNKRKPPPSSASCARHKSPSTNFLWHRIHSFRAPSSSSTSCREDPHLPHPSQPPKYTTSSGCLYQACQLYLSFVPFTQFIIRMCTPARRALRNAFEHRIEGGWRGGYVNVCFRCVMLCAVGFDTRAWRAAAYSRQYFLCGCCLRAIGGIAA